MRIEKGCLRLFRLFGIPVFLHWSWAVVAVLELRFRGNSFNSQVWNVAEYLTLFLIVLLHEFGHALACRSVGGQADRIMLWPLGGVAFVNPPPRAGALLWSIVAGPLVNVVLVPVTVGIWLILQAAAYPETSDPMRYALALVFMNAGLLIFNLLPMYPLDGGQILRALLWFIVGPHRSLSAAAWIGLAGSIGFLALAFILQDWWLVVLAVFAASQSWRGLTMAKAMRAAVNAPRHTDLRCPACLTPPPAVPAWTCTCGARFDTFATQARCPRCQRIFEQTQCLACGRQAPLAAWRLAASSDAITIPPVPASPPTMPSGGENLGT